MKYVLTTPITVGDLNNQTTIDEIELASVAINFEPVYQDNGTATLSIVVFHRNAANQVDWKYNFVYVDATALLFWRNMDLNDAVSRVIFNKLKNDGKLPAGALV